MYLSTNRYRKHVKRHISTSVSCVTYDHLSPLMQLRQWQIGFNWITAWLLQFSPRWHICFKPGPPPACSEYPWGLWPKSLAYQACFVWVALASHSSQNKLQDSYHHSQGATVSTTLLPRCHHFTLYTNASTPIFFILCQYVFICAIPSWQPIDRSRPSHQKFGMHCRVIFRPSQLFLLLEKFWNTIFLACLSWQ